MSYRISGYLNIIFAGIARSYEIIINYEEQVGEHDKSSKEK